MFKGHLGPLRQIFEGPHNFCSYETVESKIDVENAELKEEQAIVFFFLMKNNNSQLMPAKLITSYFVSYDK